MSHAPDVRRLASLIAAALGSYAIVGGIVTLIGWFSGSPRLTDWDGDGIAMFANTAIMAACGGAALVLRSLNAPWAMWPIRALGLCVALIGGTTLFQHLSGISLGIDNLLVSHTWGTTAAVAPGRPGPPASLSFTLLGGALILSTLGSAARRVVSPIAVLVSAVATLSLVGFLFHANPLFAVAHFTGIALQTATMILALAVGLLAALSDQQPVRALSSAGGAGLLARRALPVVIALPIVLGWLQVYGQQAGVYDNSMGVALLVLALVGVLCGLLWSCVAMVVHREEAVRLNEVSLREEIADRLRIEEVLARRVHEQRALYQFVDRLHRAATQQEVLDAGLDCMFNALRCDRASILLFDQAGVMRFVAWRGISEDYRQEAEGHSPWTAAESDARPFGIEDIDAAHVEEPLRSTVKAEGIRAMAFIPLIAVEKLRGKFMAYYDAPHRFSHEELELGVAIARQLEFGLERQQAEDALRSSEAMLRSITDHSLDLIFVKDRDSRTLFINPAGVCLSGLPLEKIIGRNDAEIYPEYPDQAAFYMAADRRVMDSGKPETIEEPAQTASGQTYTLLTTKTPRLDANGNVIGVIGIARDVTERKRAEERLREAALKAEAASRAKDSFLAALSHELRTPLTPALMAVAALETDPALSEDVREQLAMARRNIQLEARLIDDLLDLTRVTHGKLRIDPALVDVHELIGHAHDTIRDDLAAKSIHLTLALEAQERHVLADPTRLRQVLWNLLKNAVKFTAPSGDIRVRSFNPAPGRVAVSVEDSGIGISPEALAGIFNAFDQGDFEGRHKFGGLGLGLSISKAIIDLHGGDLRATSEGRGKGAAFVVELDTTAPTASTAPGQSAPPPPRAALRLLVVEDHEPTLALLCRLLQRDGHSVYCATTVQDALAHAARNECDLVISDLGLPDGTGFELMSEIRERYGWPGIALSGYGMEADVTMAADSGFATHLVKPVDFLRLCAAIETTLAAVAPAPKTPSASDCGHLFRPWSCLTKRSQCQRSQPGRKPRYSHKKCLSAEPGPEAQVFAAGSPEGETSVRRERVKARPICSAAANVADLLARLYNHPMNKHTGSSYDEIAEKYADAQDTKPWDIYFERPGVLQFLPDVAGKDVLDAGCGPGFYSQFMAGRGARVTAFDLNPVFVKLTQQRTGQCVKVLQADLAEPLSFAADSSFDLVVCILVMHYLKDWLPALAEFHRVLRSGGQLIFSTHHPFSDMELSPTGDYFSVDLIEDEWDIGKVQFYRRPLSRISQDLFQSGFVIEELAEPQPIPPPADVNFSSYERCMKTPMRLLVRARKNLSRASQKGCP